MFSSNIGAVYIILCIFNPTCYQNCIVYKSINYINILLASVHSPPLTMVIISNITKININKLITNAIVSCYLCTVRLKE